VSQAFKRCPICDTSNSPKASSCSNCGAALNHVDVQMAQTPAGRRPSGGYDAHYGEVDLAESEARSRFVSVVMGMLGLLLVGGIAGLAFLLGRGFMTPVSAPSATLEGVVQDATSQTPTTELVLITVTQGPPTLTPTVTPSLSPTPTQTFTPEPCIQTVGSGEGLVAVVSRCGHRSLDVIPLVVTLNGLNDENDIRANQQLIIPYPTPTIDPAEDSAPESAAPGVPVAVANQQLSEIDVRATQEIDPFFRPTATNPPGVQNYRVILGDTMASIIVEFNTTVNTLDALNPDLTFLQCEMGLQFGGPTCIVQLIEGQVIRVPVATPTPTLSPTPNGSETATPTQTATYNAPSAISPSARAYFRKDEIITLRWTATSQLGLGDTYLVTVQDLSRGQVFTAETRDLFLIVPQEWQGPDAAQYELVWNVAVAQVGRPQTASYATQPTTFTWEGRGEN
jgi:LysM repeat protein